MIVKRKKRLLSLMVMGAFLLAIVSSYPAMAAPRGSQSKTSAQLGSKMAILAAPGESITVNSLSSGLTVNELIETLIGPGIEYSNVTFIGDERAAGTFSGGAAILGLESGIVLGTGDITKSVPGPNTADDITEDLNRDGDLDLKQIVEATTYDATILEFDFVPQINRLTFQYVFASDEYNEYVDKGFNDVFAFFLNGVNVALVPGTGDRICIDNINKQKNSQYYRNNSLEDFESPPINTEMDGLTTVLTIDEPVTPGVANHIKLAIADTGDNEWDSNVFIANFRSVPPPTVQFSAANYAVNEGDGKATITVVREGDPHVAFSVGYQAQDGTAAAGSDYTSVQGTLDFAAGEMSKSFEIPIIEDDLYEVNETVQLSLDYGVTNGNGTAGFVIGEPSNAVLTIIDNDSPPAIQFETANFSVMENAGQAEIKVVRGGDLADVASVVYATSDGTATAGLDYSTVAGSVYFQPGQDQVIFSVPIIDDLNPEPAETVNLVLSDPVGLPLGSVSQAVLTIIDNDIPTTIQFSHSAYSVKENAGHAVLTVTRTGNTASAASADYYTSDGTATSGSDYSTVAGTVYFAAGQTQATFSIPIIDDTVYEGDETVNLTLSGFSGASAGTPHNAVLTIIDNDSSGGSGGGGGGYSGSFKFSLEDYSVKEDVGTATITVQRTSSTSAASVKYASSSGTAAPGLDYTDVSGTLNFAAGETSQSFTVPVIDDSDVEDSETVNLTLSSPSSGFYIGTPGKAVLTIIDNDQVPDSGIESPTDAIGHWAHDCIIALLEHGIIVGYPDKTIRPENIITRAEAAVLVVKALNLDTSNLGGTESPYVDPLPTWARDAILIAGKSNIMVGYPDGTFRPDQPITRAEMCALLVNAYKKTAVSGYTMAFADNDSIPGWAYTFMEIAAGNGIITGYPDGTVRPNRN
ncbi:MAG: Calx-beta domain-containing protein, partial [Bacillota bacterium]